MSTWIRTKRIPPQMHAAIALDLGPYSVVLQAGDPDEDSPEDFVSGGGVLVEVGHDRFLLTAAHVWDKLKQHDFLSIPVADFPTRWRMPIRYLTPTVLGSAPFGEWGPDLALLRLPFAEAGALAARGAFYNLAKDSRREWASAKAIDPKSAGWVIIGSPAARFDVRPNILRSVTGLFASRVARVQMKSGFDFIDFRIDVETSTTIPASFGGVSGAAVWRLESKPPVLDQTTEVPTRLEGIAFYQSPLESEGRFIRCHARRSIYKHLLSKLEPL